MNCDGQDCGQDPIAPVRLGTAERWIESALHHMLSRLEKAVADYRFDIASQLLYDFIWNEYCDWYLELSKVSLREASDPELARGTRRTLIQTLEKSLRALHPFMPYITEEVWQNIGALAGVTGETIMLQPFPRHDASKLDRAAAADIDWLKEFSLAVRAIRGEMNIPPGKRLPLLLREGDEEDRRRIQALAASIQQLAGVASLDWLDGGDLPESATGLCGKLEILVPLEGLIDRDAELARLDKETEKLRAEVARIEKKLANAAFVAKAPEAVVAKERDKLQGQKAALQKLLLQRERLDHNS
jgi:valyl-tRNA synthetase